MGELFTWGRKEPAWRFTREKKKEMATAVAWGHSHATKAREPTVHASKKEMANELASCRTEKLKATLGPHGSGPRVEVNRPRAYGTGQQREKRKTNAAGGKGNWPACHASWGKEGLAGPAGSREKRRKQKRALAAALREAKRSCQ